MPLHLGPPCGDGGVIAPPRTTEVWLALVLIRSAEPRSSAVTSFAPGTPVIDAAIATLSRRKWPGNIRELRTAVQRALVRRRTDYLHEDCFEGIETSAPCLDCCQECSGRPLSRAKCEEIRSVYRETGENISQAARQLGLSRTTVYKHVSPPDVSS